MSSQEMASVPIGGRKKPTFSRALSLSLSVLLSKQVPEPNTKTPPHGSLLTWTVTVICVLTKAPKDA